MKIFDLLNEIIEEVDNSRKSLFGNKKTIDVEFVLEILEEIKTALPDEIVYAPVSYTHLDVYKRQACGSSMKNFWTL